MIRAAIRTQYGASRSSGLPIHLSPNHQKIIRARPRKRASDPSGVMPIRENDPAAVTVREPHFRQASLRRKAVVARYVKADVSPKPTLDQLPQIANPTAHIYEDVAADVSLSQYSVYHRVGGFGTRASSRARLRLAVPRARAEVLTHDE